MPLFVVLPTTQLESYSAPAGEARLSRRDWVDGEAEPGDLDSIFVGPLAECYPSAPTSPNPEKEPIRGIPIFSLQNRWISESLTGLSLPLTHIAFSGQLEQMKVARFTRRVQEAYRMCHPQFLPYGHFASSALRWLVHQMNLLLRSRAPGARSIEKCW